MSLPEQEAVALGRTYGFLLALSSGEHPARPIRDGSLYDDIAAMSTNADINN